MHNMHICEHTHIYVCVFSGMTICYWKTTHCILPWKRLFLPQSTFLNDTWSYLPEVICVWLRLHGLFPFDFDISVGFRVQFMFGQSCYWDCVDIASDVTRKFPDSLALTTFPPPLPQHSLSLKCTSVFPMYPQGLCSTPLHFD